MGIIIAVIVTILVIAGIIWALLMFTSKLSTMKTTKFDKSEALNIKNTQDLLPFADISRNRIDMGNLNFVAIVKVQPYNYVIRSEDGKDSFAVRLRRAQNSIPFKLQQFTHTRKMTTDKMINNLTNTINETVNRYPDLSEYADDYLKLMSVINVQNPETGALRRVKDFYYVITWEPDSEHNGMDKQELASIADEDLQNRLRIVMNAFNQAGINTTYLSTEEIINLLTDIYHRDESNRADLVANGSYLSAMVAGDVETTRAPQDTVLTSIADGAMSQLEVEIIDNPTVDPEIRAKGIKTHELLAKIRDSLKASEKRN